MTKSDLLIQGYECIKNARKVLDAIIAVEPFHNKVWEQAFGQTFDHLQALEYGATPSDATTLGLVYIQVLESLVDQLNKVTFNKISLLDLCTIWTNPNCLDRAKELLDQSNHENTF